MSTADQDRQTLEERLAELGADGPGFGTPLPPLDEDMRQRLARLGPLYREWNARINVISRKDLDRFFTHHVQHSLTMARILRPLPGARILDVGTGGGFPGIPLAILFPEAHFTLCDSIGKKIKVVQAVVDALELGNVDAVWARAETLTDRPPFDFVISRAVTRMGPFLDWVRPLVSDEHRHALANGVLYLKGGDLGEELASVRETIKQWPLSTVVKDPWFETKQLVHVAL